MLISEVVVKGIEGHPEQDRLEIAVYDAMATRPGTQVTRSELQNDLSAIYATGWFSDVRIQPVDGPLGVQLVVTVVPNPVLTQVELRAWGKTKIPHRCPRHLCRRLRQDPQPQHPASPHRGTAEVVCRSGIFPGAGEWSHPGQP